MKAYYNQIFNPQNIVISINGNIDKDKTAEEFTKMFTPKNGRKFDYANYFGKIPAITAPKVSTKTVKDLKTDWIIIGWQAPGVLNQKDYASLQVIDALLGTGMSSRLFKNLRDCDGLAYQLGSEYAPNVLKGAFIVYIGTNPENLAIAQSKLFEQVDKLKKEFVGTKELQDAKDKLLGHYVIAGNQS